MKTTVDLPEAVLRRAKIAAVERKTTLRQLIAQSLLREIESPANSAPAADDLTTGFACDKNTDLLAAFDRIRIDGPIGKFNREDAQRKLSAAGD
jgi:hypothetical protein